MFDPSLTKLSGSAHVVCVIVNGVDPDSATFHLGFPVFAKVPLFAKVLMISQNVSYSKEISELIHVV